MPVVSIVKGNDPEVMVREAIELLGYLDSYPKRSRFLIKPNVCGGVPGKKGSYTNPSVLASMIRLLREMDMEVSVGEADSCMYTADVMLQKTGIGEVAVKSGAEVVNLSQGDMVNIDIPKSCALKGLRVSGTVAHADAIIAMPVMKTHAGTMVTLGMKTMFGILPEREKSQYHPKLDQVIVDIASILKPQLTIIDGIVGMEGEGPFKGDLVELGLIIAGNNVVATDACAAAVMGFDPESIEHLKLASEKGLGTIKIDEIEVRGEPIDRVRRPFMPATQKRIGRTLSRISKRLGYIAYHTYYEEAVRSWRRAQRKR